MNFKNKITGVVAKSPSLKTGFIPCYPSALEDELKKDLDFVFMNDINLWDTYKNTMQFLNKLDKRSKKRRVDSDIPCKPAFKVIEDEHVVGILTNTNQFIQISQPLRLDEIESELDLPSFNNSSYIINNNDKKNKNINSLKNALQSDVEIMTSKEVDYERVDYIKKIRLETSFYNVFRNTIRILINDYENSKIRDKIEKELSKEYIIYSEKLKNVEILLRELVKDKIQFIGDKNYYKLINEVTTCIVKDKETCSSEKNLCIFTENGDCNIILPERNLMTNKPNIDIYYSRMSDELVRYNRIKSFMLQPQTYLSFGNIGYKLRENEIVLLQSLLSQEYFDGLVPSVTNKYIKNNSYDEVKPVMSQVYENTFPLNDNLMNKKTGEICNIITKTHIVSSIWKKCFPENYIEIEYSKSNICTFQLIIDLIYRKIQKKLEINQIKNELFEEYKKYLENHMDKIIDILILEGKKTLGDQLQSGQINFATFLYTDNYFLTPFDLWLLIEKYNIPTIFVSQKLILQTNYTKHEFIAYGTETEAFAFIVLPGFRAGVIPNYRLIQTNENNIFIELNKLNENCIDEITNCIKNKISIEDYLQNFSKPQKKYKKKNNVRLIIESDSEETQQNTEKKTNIKKPNKLIIEQTSPSVSSEEYILQPKHKSKKQVEIKGKKNKTAKNKKNPKTIVNIENNI
jgi:hypothetical protein